MENAFLEDVAALPLNIVYSTDDADDKLEIFNSLFKSSIDRHAPLRKMKITRPPAPWLNAEDIKQLQSERNKLRHLAHVTKKDNIWQLFREIRNKIKTKIKETKRSFYRKALSSRKPKDLWRTIYRILHPSQQQISADPNVLNHHFSTTSQRLLGTSPSSPDDLRNLINTFPVHTNHSFTLRPATFQEVLSEIKGLRSDCSTGPDQIPVKYIKLAADWIASPLNHIINHYISNNSFPKAWKLARVSPIPKTDHPVESDDFRPIAILPVLSKIYERLVLKQLLLYIEDHNILHTGMSGFRKGHSTNSVLLRIRDDIIRAMKKEVTLIAFADFSKAFDTVEYATVSKKLHNVGFSHDAIYWVLNYLTDRKQYVQINEKQSQVVDLQFGVPQGSTLGPVLLNLYVNDLEPVLECSCYQYADDTTLYRHSVPSKIHECAKKLQDAMTVLENWATESNLALNETKTKQMLIATSKMSRAHELDTVVPDIRVKAQTLEKVDEFKLLGTWFSNNLKWGCHIKHVTSSCDETGFGGEGGFILGKVSRRTFNAYCLFSSAQTALIKALDEGELLSLEEEISITQESSDGIVLASSTIMTCLSSTTMSDLGGEHGRRGSDTVVDSTSTCETCLVVVTALLHSNNC